MILLVSQLRHSQNWSKNSDQRERVRWLIGRCVTPPQAVPEWNTEHQRHTARSLWSKRPEAMSHQHALAYSSVFKNNVNLYGGLYRDAVQLATKFYSTQGKKIKYYLTYFLALIAMNQLSVP